MNTQWSASKLARFLVIVMIALPGVGLGSKFSSNINVYPRHPHPKSVCNSEEPVLLNSNYQITDLAADRQYLYGLTRGDPGVLVKISKRSGKDRVLAELDSSPVSMLVDHRSIFWVEHAWQPEDSYTLKKVDKRGKKLVEFWQAPEWMNYLSMDHRYLYWLNHETDSVLRMSKKGGEPKTLVSGLESISNFSIVKRQKYIGGREGLYVLERPSQTPRMLISSEKLLQDLNIGLRDERSLYYAGPVIAKHNGEIIFVFSVANNPGMGSCNDNNDHIVALPKMGGKPRILLTLSGSLLTGSLVDSDLYGPYLYTVGLCQGGQVTNLNTGETSAIEYGGWGWGASSISVDKGYIYWADREGLKCMQRPTE